MSELKRKKLKKRSGDSDSDGGNQLEFTYAKTVRVASKKKAEQATAERVKPELKQSISDNELFAKLSEFEANIRSGKMSDYDFEYE